MKKTLTALTLSLVMISSAQAGLNQTCLNHVTSAVESAVSLYPDIVRESIKVKELRSTEAVMTPMEGEASVGGYRVYNVVSFKRKKVKEPVLWLTESGVIFDEPSKCSVLYSNLDVAS